MRLADFRRNVTRLDGATVMTKGRGRPFVVRAEPDGLLIQPESGTERRIPWPRIEKLLDRFQATSSWAPSDYRDVSFDASYLLAIVEKLTTVRNHAHVSTRVATESAERTVVITESLTRRVEITYAGDAPPLLRIYALENGSFPVILHEQPL